MMALRFIDKGFDSLVYQDGDVVLKEYVRDKFWTECFQSKCSLEKSLSVLEQYYADTLKANDILKEKWKGSDLYEKLICQGYIVDIEILPQGEISIKDAKIISRGQKFISGPNYGEMDDEDWGNLIGAHQYFLDISKAISEILIGSFGREFRINPYNMKPSHYDGQRLEIAVTDMARSIVSCYTGN